MTDSGIESGDKSIGQLFGLQMVWCLIPELNSEIPELQSVYLFCSDAVIVIYIHRKNAAIIFN
ncbi:MAG: hypothetical protein ABWZ56_07880 [Flavobacterium sp.]